VGTGSTIKIYKRKPVRVHNEDYHGKKIARQRVTVGRVVLKGGKKDLKTVYGKISQF